ncbi:MAG: hypothetical protein QM739_11395 [Propionivibrio sp.]
MKIRGGSSGLLRLALVALTFFGLGVTAETAVAASCTSVATGNWSAASTWNCGSGVGSGPPATTDTVTINTYTVSLNTTTSVAALTINSGTLRQTGNATRTLTVTGDVVNSGTVADNGTTGSFSLTVGGNLTVNGTSFTVDTLTVSGNTTISKPFTVNSTFSTNGDLTNNSAAFTVASLVFQKSGTQAFTLYGTSNVITNLTVNSGSTVSSSNYSVFSLKGTLTNNGAFSLPNSVVTLNGTAAQSIAGSSDSTLGSLTMNNASGLTLSRNVIVPGTLTLTSGVIATGSYSLSATANCPAAVSGGSASSYVNGKLRLTYPAWSVTCAYPVGSAAAYAPITVAVPYFSGISGGTLTGSTVASEHPQVATSGINSALDANRYWTLGASGDTMATLPSGGSYTVTLGFVAADVDSGATVSNFKVGLYDGAAWSTLAGSASGTTANYSGSTVFGSYATGTPVVATLGKSASAASAALNSYVTFNLTATNPSGAMLSNVVLTDVIPAGITYKANIATSGSVAVSGQTLTWTIPSIAAGATEQLTLVVQMSQKGTFTNTVTSPGAASASASILVLAGAFVHYRLDEAVGSWNGTAGEVKDSGANALNGRRRSTTTTTATTTNTVSPSTTIASQNSAVVGGFCNAASFDGNAVVESANSSFFQFTNKLSASAWIYVTDYPSGSSEFYSILSNDTNYEFHLTPAGKLYWWWNSSSLTSATTIPKDQWTHVAITMDSSLGTSSRERIYINGVLDANTNNWGGTLETNACPLYIGGDISTGSSCTLLPGRNFKGKIDEVKTYNYELSAAEVNADMTLGRQCGAVAFDHVRIIHDGTASKCSPKTVTVKACLDTNCTSLYPGTVTVNLTPTGWNPSDTVTITNGVTTAVLKNSSITSDVTLGGTVPAAYAPANQTVRCFNGATESCTLSVAAASCAFDAVETGASPQTHIYTKLADTAFNLDLLALTTSGTINSGYTGTVAVDLVDSSSSSCPSGTGLSTAVNVSFASSGRKSVSFTYPNAARNVRVRAIAGSASPACSSDNFAIRPAQFSVSSSMTNATLSGTPKAVAGTAFALTAGAGVTSGYNGTPAIDATKVNDHNGVVIASSTLSGSFSAGTGGAASGSSFKYLDVGNIQLATDAVVDTGFTAVDQSTDCIAGSSSNDLSGGKYGCNIGSVSSDKFGRWYPSHYSFSGALTPVCIAGGFTYMDQDALGVALTLKAHASTGAIASASDPVVSRYGAGYTNLAPVTLSGDNNGTGVAVTRLGSPDFPAMPNTALWSSGLFQIDDKYAFAKLANPDGPYDLFKLSASLVDPDGSTLISPMATNTTRIRNGRTRLDNAYGSELLDLPLRFVAEYWNGAAGWVTNTLDSCTGDVSLGAGNAVSVSLASSPSTLPTCVLDSGNPGLSGVGCESASLSARRFKEGAATSVGFLGDFNLWLQAPGANNVGATTISTSVPTWLQFNWTGLVGSPTAKASFGVYKPGPVIYRREMY